MALSSPFSYKFLIFIIMKFYYTIIFIFIYLYLKSKNLFIVIYSYILLFNNINIVLQRMQYILKKKQKTMINVVSAYQVYRLHILAALYLLY